MAKETPNSYKDPFWSNLAFATEAKLELPKGVLVSLLTNGEKSNNDQVSEAGAKTPFQIIPETRNAAIKKYGIDPYLSPENAAEVAGLLLKDSLKRNNNDVAAAIGEYHGGTNRDNWGPRTNAYVQRVLSGAESINLDSLKSGFGEWLKQNPAVPAQQQTEVKAPSKAEDSLAAGFGQWLQMQNGSLVDKIPGGAPSKPQQPQPEPSFTDKALGALEAGANAVTGLVAGAPAMAVGGAQGIIDSVRNGTFGTPEGVRQAEAKAMDYAGSVTYQPRTATGQEYANNVGEVMQNAVPLVAVAPELGAITQAAKPAAVQAVEAVKQTGGKALTVGKQAATAVAEKIPGMAPESPAAAFSAGGMGSPTPGTMGSAGAAATDIATQRRMLAEDLPVPIKLTEGQATRDFAQTQFEREAAKNPTIGAPLRERFEQQNAQILKNFDAWLDQTGAESPNLRDTGVTVTKAIKAKADAVKTKIRDMYKKAEAAGELEAPIKLENLVNHINESAPEASTAPVLDVARRKLIQIGAAADADGVLVPLDVPLKKAEMVRQAISRATNFEPTNIRQSSIMKGLIDDQTAGLGGDLYQQARKLRAQYAREFENRAVISDLLNNKRGMDDRKVAYEDVFKHSVLDGSLDDVRMVRRTLQTQGEEGKQAWRELQGQTIAHIRDAATKNVARDSTGNSTISPAGLDKAIKALDKDGKLDFVFGRKGAQQLRDINDLSKVVFTVPANSVNSSNTASILLAALDMGVSSASGLPLPVTSGLKMIVGKIKDRKLAARVRAALK